MLTTGSAPWAVPVLGHAYQLGRRPLDFLDSLPAHGDLVQIKLGPWRAHVLCHPDLVHQVLVDDRTFDKGGPFIDRFRDVVGDSLGTCRHRDHRRQRRLVQPAFHRRRMPGYGAVASERIDAVIRSWQHGQMIDVPAEMHDLTMATVTRTLFANAVEAPLITEIGRCVEAVTRGVARRVVLPVTLIGKIPTTGNRRFDRARDRLHRLTGGLIADYRRAGVDHGDLLSMLLTTEDDDGPGMTDEEIHDQVLMFFLAAVEATPALLSWACYLLGRHPEIQARLQDEADAVLAGSVAEHDDLPRLGLTQRVVTETLRLYPPGWLLTRTTTADVELAGHPVPAGTTIVFSPYLLGRRAELFPDPGRFDPDRWLDGEMRLPRGAFVPFGEGARKCIGDGFAKNQAALTLASIAARWRLQLTPSFRVRAAWRAVLAPRSLPMRPARR
ncbi:cytochrome P450 [Actinomadura rudentiformis]|uniref:Cytochrome P450 n=1 Tax=Actinomadura rudentiformis TaxID=359158 RepID=A0A6H9YM84_9ACTN|nr:cytochrome P450 [Actinomadura rudentiformis]KAB2346910.1 cytochrome P450 [Actinomadura rudentiformis]